MTVIMQIAVSFIPSDIEEGILMFEGVKRIFDFMPRLVIASLGFISCITIPRYLGIRILEKKIFCSEAHMDKK